MTDTDIVISKQGAFIAPVADIKTALRRYQAVKEFMDSILKEGVDYGKVPGSDKPALLKPGAEKMTAFFGFQVHYILVDKTEDWLGKEHDGEPFFYYVYKCQLWRGDQLIAEGEGSCNSWEKKYRYRQAERICPKCGKSAIIPGKEEYGGGWLCYSKKGGCGAKFNKDAKEITDQQLGQVKNADPADIVNTLQKMAQKRALVAPVLIATNTSDYFTQDIDDFIDGQVIETVTTNTPAVETKVSNPPPEEEFVDDPPADQKSDITLQEAMAVTGSDGKSYGQCINEVLDKKKLGIRKAIAKKDISLQDRELYEYKLEAIRVIQDARKAHKIG